MVTFPTRLNTVSWQLFCGGVAHLVGITHKMFSTRLSSRVNGVFQINVCRTSQYICPACQKARLRFSTGARRLNKERSPFRTRIRDTKIQWKPIPVGLGIGFLGAVQFYRVREREREKRRQEEEDAALEEERRNEDDSGSRPKRRKRIRPSGPW